MKGFYILNSLLVKIDEKIVFNFLLIIWILSIPFKNAIFQGSISLLIIFFVFYIFKTKNFSILKENLIRTKFLAIGFFSIILCMIISNLINTEYLTSKSWHATFMFFVRYGIIFIVLAYFYKLNFFTKKTILSALLGAFLLLMLTGFYEIITNPLVLSQNDGIKGSLDYRNAFGLSMGIAVVFSFYLLNFKKNLALLLIPIFVFFMIFSYSRSSWVASSASFLVFILVNKDKLKISHLFYFLLFLLFVFILYFSFDTFQHRFHQLLEGDSSYRFQIWSYTLEFIKEKIFFGYGMHSWSNLPNTFLNGHADAHNSILEILVYTGILGLLASLFTIFVVLYKIYQTKNFIFFPMATYFLVVTQFDFTAYGSKELLSYLTLFVFFVYSEEFKSKI